MMLSPFYLCEAIPLDLRYKGLENSEHDEDQIPSQQRAVVQIAFSIILF